VYPPPHIQREEEKEEDEDEGSQSLVELVLYVLLGVWHHPGRHRSFAWNYLYLTSYILLCYTVSNVFLLFMYIPLPRCRLTPSTCIQHTMSMIVSCPSQLTVALRKSADPPRRGSTSHIHLQSPPYLLPPTINHHQSSSAPPARWQDALHRVFFWSFR
jgi:hypothetical protein